MNGPVSNLDSNGAEVSFNRRVRAENAWASLLRAMDKKPHLEQLIEDSDTVKSSWETLGKRYALSRADEITSIELALSSMVLEEGDNPITHLSKIEALCARGRRVDYNMNEDQLMNIFTRSLSPDYDHGVAIIKGTTPSMPKPQAIK